MSGVLDPRIEAVHTGLQPPMRIIGEDIRWTMDERLAAYDCPGVSVAVIEGGELAWAKGFGVKEKGRPEPIDEATLFSGASISKAITAAVALRLVERGAFDLDADVNRYLSSWKVPENEFTAAQPVTLRRLLSHRAGTTVHGFGAFPPGEALPTVIDVLEGRPPAKTKPVQVDKTPGGAARYSGGGTMIVQLMLEEASQTRFADLARAEIFQPLGLSRSTFECPLPKPLESNAAVGHEEGKAIDGKWVCVPQLAAGGVWTTPTDFASFMIACRDAWLGKPGAFLRQDLAREMMTPQGGEFGLGWELLEKSGDILFGHGGSNAGYQCESKCFLEGGRGAVVMTNAESGLIFYWEVFAAVARAHGWDDFLPAPKKVVPVPADQLDRLVGSYDIVSGVEMPELKVWVENGRLFTHIEGMRGGPNETLMDDRGRLFSRRRPSETEVIFGPDGRAQELVVRSFGVTEILRMRRQAQASAER
ncbi:MAG TPA: serine hydrolase domain-containing protein [Caulobacteraceae bacterium]|nr:serine hydrolase domain-containing protein [Caulobacteraceae bacterium]